MRLSNAVRGPSNPHGEEWILSCPGGYGLSDPALSNGLLAVLHGDVGLEFCLLLVLRLELLN